MSQTASPQAPTARRGAAADQQRFVLRITPCPMRVVCPALLLLLFVLLGPQTLAAAPPFPHYSVLKNNVRFWEDIYSRYSTSQAIIHDSDDLEIRYEVIPIFNHRIPGASKINKPVFRGIKKKYSRILGQLAKGIKPRTAEEKRVAALFGKASRRRLQKAADSVRIQIGQKDRFLEGVILSGAYMAEIRQIFKKHGLPQDLAYLPHVESSFNLKAYSRVGASGIWQFTRSTGKQFLTINDVVDERQDPILASRAAARFLKDNYELLGSWPLALTAYNYGPAGMLRAKKAHGSYKKIFQHYEQGYFKFASRNFYSEFLAALNVAKKLEKSPAVQLAKPTKTLHFTLPAYVAIDDLCRYFNISTASVKKSNPALRKPVLQGKKYLPRGLLLHLPYSKQHKNLLSSIPAHIYHKKQKPTEFYRVRPGDTAGKIAQAHGLSLKSLKQANGLGRNAVIFAGQQLRIPGQSRSQARTAAPLNAGNKKKSVQRVAGGGSKQTPPLLAGSKKQTAARKSSKMARSAVLGDIAVHKLSPKQNPSQGTIRIQPEESLELIAGWLQLTPAALRKLNNFPSNRLLHPDEEIRIVLKHTSAQKFEEKRFAFHIETEEKFFNAFKVIGVQTYTVKKGDTVWEICRTKFDLPFWLLKKYNTNLNFSGLRSSQQLTIPIVKTI